MNDKKREKILREKHGFYTMYYDRSPKLCQIYLEKIEKRCEQLNITL